MFENLSSCLSRVLGWNNGFVGTVLIWLISATGRIRLCRFGGSSPKILVARSEYKGRSWLFWLLYALCSWIEWLREGFWIIYARVWMILFFFSFQRERSYSLFFLSPISSFYALRKCTFAVHTTDRIIFSKNINITHYLRFCSSHKSKHRTK